MILATKRTHRPHDGSAAHFVSAQREPDGLSNGKNKCQEVRQLSLPQTEYMQVLFRPETDSDIPDKAGFPQHIPPMRTEVKLLN